MRTLWFQLHWLLGISAGLVLAVIGVSGALLSFENELLRALNRGLMTVDARAETMLSPSELLDRIAAAQPQRPIGTLSLSAVPGRAARVGFLAPQEAGSGKPPARPRMDVYFVDPYTGALLGHEDDLRGHAVLHWVEELHRTLAAGDTGKAITGASTLTLLILAATGLYLRWPRRWRDWRAWLAVRWRLRASPFLKSLHEVIGTWLLIPYLLVALTGLWWSYAWYRDGLLQLAGAPRPARPILRAADQNPAPATELDRAWSSFLRETQASGYSSVSFNVPGAGQPLTLTYLDAKPQHERASNRLTIDLSSGAVIAHERYSEKAFGGKLVGSVFVLHKGSYFGIVGTVIVMVCSLAMPVFAVTGWMLYLKRRAIKRRMAASARAMRATSESAPG